MRLRNLVDVEDMLFADYFYPLYYGNTQHREVQDRQHWLAGIGG